MADKLLRAQVIWRRLTDDPQDIITNTWHFDGDDPGDPPGPSDEDYYDGVVSLLTTFYDSIKSLYSDLVLDNPFVRIYDLRDPSAPGAPRVPRHIEQMIVNVPATAAGGYMVEEAAVVLSCKAAAGSGLNPARRRGRVYLGPLNTTAVAVSNGRVRVHANARTLIANAANVMMQGYGLPLDQGDIQWAIYSRRTDELGANLDDSFHDVVGGWVDDAFDTQRSRGPAPTSRTTFGV